MTTLALAAAALAWRLRRAFWNRFAIFKYGRAKPDTIGVPRPDRRLTVVPLVARYPGIEIAKVPVADRVPADEAYPLKRLFAHVQAALYRIVDPMQAGLPPVSSDPAAALNQAFTAAHEACYPRPIRPREIDRGPDIGALAVASPYSCYLHKELASGTFRWDFRELEGYDCHVGLRSPAAVVDFRVDDAGGVRAERIDCDAGSIRAGETGWDVATKLALCAATTHLSLVRHFNNIHLACGAHMAIATRNELPPHHPLRRLIWPHVYGTQYSNDIITIDQMVRRGDFESVFSFTHEGMCRLFEDTYERFDLVSINPQLDATRRGVVDAGFSTPALDNRYSLYAIIERHCRRYVAVYYPSAEALAADRSYARWVQALDRNIPNGVSSLAGPGFSLDGAVRLLATLVYLATVEHEVVGSGLWDYQLWTDVQPVRVARNGDREPLDVYQRLVNANLNLNVRRTALTTDFSYLAIDSAGAAAFDLFRAELLGYERDMDKEPAAAWRMVPGRLKANINA